MLYSILLTGRVLTDRYLVLEWCIFPRCQYKYKEIVLWSQGMPSVGPLLISCAKSRIRQARRIKNPQMDFFFWQGLHRVLKSS
jgi:hypothetical protein